MDHLGQTPKADESECWSIAVLLRNKTFRRFAVLVRSKLFDRERNLVLKKLVGTFVGLAMMGMVGAAQATLIDNGTTTIDDATNFEWLDLTQTTDLSYNEVQATSFVTSDGYHIATGAELCGLFGSLGDTIAATCATQGSDTGGLSAANAATLVALLGSTLGTGSSI